MERRLSDMARAEVIRLYQAGWTMAAIARYVGATRATVSRILQQAGLYKSERQSLHAAADRWIQIRSEVQALQRCPACLGKKLEVQVQDGQRVVRCQDADCRFTWIRPALAEAVSSVSSTADSIASKEVNHDG
jgi:transcriptional regulator